MSVTALYLILAIAGLVAIWLPVMLVATLFSGWWELSRTYPYMPPTPGDDGSPIIRLQGSVYFSPLFRYQRFVHAVADQDHLHLSMPPLIGAFHKPMSIPWEQITFPRRDRTVMGMIPLDIGPRRVLVSRSFVKDELEVRSLADNQNEFDAYSNEPDDSESEAQNQATQNPKESSA